MLVTIIDLLAITVFASIVQKNYKIPSPITIISVVLGLFAFDFKIFDVNSADFDTLVLTTLPLLIAADAMKIKWEELKEHFFSLFFVAVIIVALSVAVGTLINNYVLVDYPLPLAAVVILFCMVSATDPIIVSAIFNNFNVPHRLKILTEGESLFNDATALIIFSIALVALKTPDAVTPTFITFKSLSVIFGAIFIGSILGYLTIWALKLSDEPLVESSIILLFAYLSYLIGEHFHFSGILAVIFCIVISNKFIQKIISEEEEHIKKAYLLKSMWLMKHAVTTKDNQVTIIKSIEFVSMLAAAALFVSIAAITNIDKLLSYSYEIFAVFIASTLIRGFMMFKFAFVSNSVKKMQSINVRWWSVLTFAGSKGAISILMVHMLPNSFEYKELFEYIIIGNILLSTFIYALILGVIFVKYKDKFDKECLEEENHH